LAPLTLRWERDLDSRWPLVVRRGIAIHAVHLTGPDLVQDGLEILRHDLGPDFLVLPCGLPGSREAGFRLLGQLEALLEATAGRGVKLALRLDVEAAVPVLDLLREARAEAVGFCWHPGLLDAEPLADRLWCGVCAPDSDLRPLQRLGYRWDMALPAGSPEQFKVQAAALEKAHPPVLFPAELPATVLGRPVVPDDGLVFGRHWERPGERS
jgi:hypothetical protein